MLAFSKEDLERVPPVDFSQAKASKSDISIRAIWSSKIPEKRLTTSELGDDFDRNVPTKVLIHGYTSHPQTPWYNLYKNEYFKNDGPRNIVFVDWSKAAMLPYLQSAANASQLGEFLADILLDMKIPPELIHLIGHSLGGHIGGFVGKHYLSKSGGLKIARITALDPAGPAFEKTDPQNRINRDWAEFVDVVHTDMGYFGFTQPVGHVDFYPNGGKNQPGCLAHAGLDSDCNHSRAAYLFGESINFRAKTALEAEFLHNEDDCEIRVVENGERIVFGDATPPTTRGIFYLDTNALLPFLI